MTNIDMETVIEDAVNDSVDVETAEVETSPETTEVEVSSPEETPESTETAEVSSPAAKPEVTDDEGDEFAKKFGLQATSITGKENRIPYSRVKKIVERNAKETEARVRKELEGAVNPKVAEYETKVKDYEGRLARVAQFEHILENDPKTFLNMLSEVPAYKEFFAYISKLQAPVQEQEVPTGRPEPDQVLADGSRAYSMEGLNKLMAWQAAQVEERVSKQVASKIEQRYAPIEQDWQAQRQMQAAIPVIQKQIAEARTWPQFNENEEAIVEALKADQSLSLEGAYRKVVFPKLQTSRDDMRKSILDELKKKPTSTAVPTNASKPKPEASNGPRNLLDVVTEAAATLK